jgi:diadenosine tetraphosphate (Ap4A) HIT family hydrolase
MTGSTSKLYESACEGCSRSQGNDAVMGGIVRLSGDWILNHLGGPSGFLGWMALQPRYHRMELAELTPEEAAALGSNIQRVEAALRQSWFMKFPEDPIRRMYVVYFFESIFDKKPTKFHLHIHLIPRTEMYGEWLQDSEQSGIIAWDIYKIGDPMFGLPSLPDHYKKTAKNVTTLMGELSKLLQGGVSAL